MMKRAVVLNVVKPEYRRSLPFDEQTMVFYPKPSLASQNKGPSGRLFDPVDNISTDEEDEPEFKIGIPGYRAIFGKDSRPLRQLVWIFLTLVFFFLAVVQVHDRIDYYLKTPIHMSVVVASNNTLVFPRITICNRNILNRTLMDEKMAEAARTLNVNQSDLRTPSDLLSVTNYNVTTLWSTFGNNISVLAGKECWFGRGKQCYESGQWLAVHTVRGPCYSYDVRSPVSETGLFFGLYMQIEGNKGNIKKAQNPDGVNNSLTNGAVGWSSDFTDGWMYEIHSAHVNPALAFLQPRIYESPSSNVDVQIRLSQSAALNVWHKPCVDDVGYTLEKCELECFSDWISRRFQFECRLPFMEFAVSSPFYQTLNYCNETESYRQTILKLDIFLTDNITDWDPSICNCSGQCYTTDYEINTEKVLADVKPNRLRFRVFFQDKTYEKSTEDIVYDLTTLFCDIGNSVGLLLGASALTVMEALEWGFFSLMRWMFGFGRANKSRRVRPCSNPANSINVVTRCDPSKG